MKQFIEHWSADLLALGLDREQIDAALTMCILVWRQDCGMQPLQHYLTEYIDLVKKDRRQLQTIEDVGDYPDPPEVRYDRNDDESCG